MRLKFAALFTVVAALTIIPAHGFAAQTLCGWIVNPTPANWWIADAKKEWILSTQGGASVDGMDMIPDLTTRDWVVTNGSSYGYGCGCMKVEIAKGEIIRIRSFTQKKLATCSRDKRLGRAPS
jgi:hypothetical protein